MRPTPAHPEQTLTLRLKVISCELLAVLWTNPQSECQTFSVVPFEVPVLCYLQTPLFVSVAS